MKESDVRQIAHEALAEHERHFHTATECGAPSPKLEHYDGEPCTFTVWELSYHNGKGLRFEYTGEYRDPGMVNKHEWHTFEAGYPENSIPDVITFGWNHRPAWILRAVPKGEPEEGRTWHWDGERWIEEAFLYNKHLSPSVQEKLKSQWQPGDWAWCTSHSDIVEPKWESQPCKINSGLHGHFYNVTMLNGLTILLHKDALRPLTDSDWVVENAGVRVRAQYDKNNTLHIRNITTCHTWCYDKSDINFGLKICSDNHIPVMPYDYKGK